MSDDKMSDNNKMSGNKESVAPDSTPASEIEIGQPELAAVEAPPLAPVLAPTIEPIRAPADATKPEPASTEAAPVAETAKASFFSFPKMPSLGERARWRGLIAASVTFAAGVGAAIGAVAVATKNNPASVSAAAAAAQEREVMQKTIQKLNQEMSSLRSSLETQAKSTSAQLGKLNDKIKDNDKILEASRRVAASSSDITGSILPPATVPVPTPRPPSTLKSAVIEGWSIRSARDGLVLVEGRGEIFEVVPGAPLPGLGVVEDVKRENGRWVVVTAKGIIVASNRPRGPYDRY